MSDRQPFVYPDWCTGPVVDIDMPPGFPVCDYVTFTRPTYMHVPRIDPPDIDPPPFCPCIPTIIPTTDATWNFGGSNSVMDIKIVPVAQDCCNPDFRITFDIEVPCMPFDMVATSAFTEGASFANKPYLNIRHVTNTCKFEFNLKLPRSAGQPIELCMYEHGEGIKFIDCCSGTGYIGLDSTMENLPMGTLSIALIQHINLKIPRLAALANYDQSGCATELATAKNTVYDPWTQPCTWRGVSNENGPVDGGAGNFKLKYCCSKSIHH